ncbi:dynein-related subfamily AAA family protein [Amycolatopsis sulphurea]|uniref:Dynein-related subfamily AAA family protein n=1 Tax=Amycolatopsis sulphurea TaxID=76022 RepID=A0A2A9FGE7_9PSEU|nr:MoxR family ATPase [Amycolatopsis sulphurea]PFG50434.1 dynein-related subfamily AAA family protein [Amycolatopsis sulphurea]
MSGLHAVAGPGAVPGPASFAGAVVGREREIELLLAGLDAGAHVVLEGPPGTGKTTLLRVIASAGDAEFVFVEGNAELTPARLIGHFDPSQVLAKRYSAETFVDGPLAEALRSGGLLYVEEVNRVPGETLDVLITVMSEGERHAETRSREGPLHRLHSAAATHPPGEYFRPTDDEDPLPAARSCAELVILAPADDCAEAAGFARWAGARWRPLPGLAAAPAALAKLLDRS